MELQQEGLLSSPFSSEGAVPKGFVRKDKQWELLHGLVMKETHPEPRRGVGEG